tara:strand:- start:963 stop:1850 length:888 start_codon:yes stop_codon:yes gene_type:complete
MFSKIKNDFPKKSDQNYVDLLDEDKSISGQKFVCLSFISPEKVLKNKELFIFQEFLKKWDFLKSLEKFQQFIHFISFKYKMDINVLQKDLEDFAKEERSNLIKSPIEDDFKNFLDTNEEELESMFNSKYNFQTNVRGIKVRGSFPTQEEAEIKCKSLREVDPNHDVFVGPVGVWMPWDPEAYKTNKVEYMEEELNQLMHEKIDNEKNAKQEFEKRVKEAKEKAMEDNKALAEKTGNILTQKLNEDGELVNTSKVNFDDIPDENVIIPDNIPSANIKNELFDSMNVSTKKDEEEKE